MKHFKAKVELSFYIMLVMSAVFGIFLFLSSYDQKDSILWIALLICFSSFVFFILFWALFSTKYACDNVFLYYQSAFLKGKIKIQDIKSIQRKTTLWVGNKPAMARNGMIVKYNFEEVYLAPVLQNELIEELKNINPNIELI